MLDVRSNRTQRRQCGDDCRRSGGQPESEEDGVAGGACIVGNVVELEEEEKGTSCSGCRSKYWAHEEQRDELCKNREDRRDGFSAIREHRDDGFVQSSNHRKLAKTFGEDRWDDEV